MKNKQLTLILAVVFIAILLGAIAALFTSTRYETYIATGDKYDKTFTRDLSGLNWVIVMK